MNNRRPPELEMNLQGEFVQPPTPPLATRILFWAVVVAAIAGALSVAAFAISLAFVILPVAVIAAGVAWLMYRFRMWQLHRSAGARGNLWQP
jgi:hypothetical protein